MKYILKIFLVLSMLFGCSKEVQYDLVILNGDLYDGTGGQPVKQDIAINGSSIVKIGKLSSYIANRIIDANGLAVVPVSRGACGGCFNIVPPQRQADIRESKKIIVCEHCGRILSEVTDEIVAEEKKTKRSRRTA